MYLNFHSYALRAQMSMLEIYNESVRDLLSEEATPKGLDIRQVIAGSGQGCGRGEGAAPVNRLNVGLLFFLLRMFLEVYTSPIWR